VNKFFTVLLLAFGLGSCQRSDVGPHTAPIPLAKGQVMRYDITYDAQGQHPRVRWIVQLAAPLKIRGWNDRDFTQVKVFTLPDTTAYQPGVKFNFTYRVRPQAQQTAWATAYEWVSMLDFPPGYVPNPELELANVELR
jgi:hypothetical protein